MGNYTTAAEVKAYKLNGSAALQSGLYTDGEIDAKIALVESMVENITGDIFYSKTETNRFDGTGKRVLWLNSNAGIEYPLISSTSVTDVDIDGQLLNTFVKGVDYVDYPYYLEVSVSFPEDTPRRGTFRGGVWPRGQKNIVVVGTWGKETTPPEIKEVANLLTLEMLVKGSTEMQSTGASSVSWPDFTISFKGESKAAESTGFLETDRYLQRFINYIGLFQQPQPDPPLGSTSILRGS